MIKLWQNIKHPDMAKIEKVVGEYKIELKKGFHKKIKVKIFLKANGQYIGFTNLQLIDEGGGFYSAVGLGNTEEKALRDTITEYIKMLSTKSEWKKTDFEYSDLFDF